MGSRRWVERHHPRTDGDAPAHDGLRHPVPPGVEAVLAVQRTAGNHAAADLLQRHPPPARTLQRMTVNQALPKLAKLVQNVRAVSPLGEAKELLDIRAEVEEVKRTGDGNTQIPPALEAKMARIETILINNADANVDMAAQIEDTAVGPFRDAMTLIGAGGGMAPDLDLAMLVSKINRKGKMDLEIDGGTTQPAVRAAAQAQGYRPFEHVHYTQTPDPAEPEKHLIALSKPSHPAREEFDAHIRTHLQARQFVPLPGPDIIVYSDATNTPAMLDAALNAWHPGIASDKTQPGEFREDAPHPGVTNPVHSTRPHTHLQAPGCMQTTIVI